VPAGFKFTADDAGDGFSILEVTSSVPQTFTIALGDDDVSFSNAVTVSGNVSTQDLPATAITGATKTTIVTAGAALVAANLARRRVTIFSDPANVGAVVYIRVAGGARLGAITPGQLLQFNGTYALDYEDATAGDNLYIAEET
jgi:hypothetical protein